MCACSETLPNFTRRRNNSDLEQQNRVQKTEDQALNLIAEYETRLKTEPNNVRLLRNIAELYTQKKQFRSGATESRPENRGPGAKPDCRVRNPVENGAE